MSFTFSHPAAVLPLVYLPKKFVSVTGLVIGSMMPDAEYFFRMSTKSAFSHTFAGVFLFCLPIGILTCFLFHNIIRDSFIGSLPLFLKARLNRIAGYDWNKRFIKRWHIISLSIITGAALHVFWDNFTHWNYNLLWYWGTAIGLAIIFLALYKIPKDNEVTGKIDTKYWILFFFLTAAVLLIYYLNGLLHFAPPGYTAAGVISACLISITAVSGIWKWRAKRELL